MNEDSNPTIRDLYPHLTDAELTEAEDNLERYIAVVLRIFERLDREANAQPDILASGSDVISCNVKKGQSFE